MSRLSQRHRTRSAQGEARPFAGMRHVTPLAAGVDMGAHEIVAGVPDGEDQQIVRTFGTSTTALHTLADWFVDRGIQTVAMASTGVDGMPVFELLEARGWQGLLIDPRQATRAPGRPPTARLDGTWRPRLHPSGLLAGALRPEAHVCVRRSALRHRQMLRTYAAHPLQHRHKACAPMHCKRTPGVRERTGGPLTRGGFLQSRWFDFPPYGIVWGMR